jgi:hypothetical protein
MRALFGKIVREPLVHFLALGALIFAAHAVLHPAPVDAHRIEITQADIARIQALYAQQWGAAPRADDMPSLIDNYIRSEVLFREGTALGLGTEDSVLRNRVVQKMEFLLQDTSSIPQPSDAEIAAYFQGHADAYRVPEQIAFTHVYFNASVRADRAEADAKAALAALTASGKLGSAGEVIGDPFMLGDDPSMKSQESIARDYGGIFASTLFGLPEGSWQGPIASTYGVHLVRVLERQPARLPDLTEVRDRVHDDLMAERLHVAVDSAYARVRSKYQVVVDPPPPSGGGPLAAGLK